MVPAVVCWSIWKEQNNRVFNVTAEPAFQVFRKKKDNMVSWAVHWLGSGSVRGVVTQDWDAVIGLR